MNPPTETKTPLTDVPAFWRRILRSKIGISSLVLVLVGGIWFVTRSSTPKLPDAAFIRVSRGDFRVTIMEGGSLQAVNELTVRCELEGTSRILSLVPEGTYVKKGDLLVEIDSAALRDSIVQQEIALQNETENFRTVETELLIQKSTVATTLQTAELTAEFAAADLRKYQEGDWPQQKKVSESAIAIAQEELRRAEDRYSWTVELQKKGYATKTEMEADGLSVKQKQIAVDQATEVLRLLVEFDNPKAVRQLTSALANAKTELEQSHQRSEAQLSQFEAKLAGQKEKLELQKTAFERLKAQLANTHIVAPQNGLVIYADGNSQSGYLVEEGGLVRQRQELIKLPDISKMMVKLWIHESQVNLVKPGMQAFITVDSLLNRQFNGKVGEISLLPDVQQRQGNQNFKVYATQILIDETLPDLKPGVSARAEIIVAEQRQTLTVPIQTVTTRNGVPVCHLRAGQNANPVPVQIGLASDQRVEIVGGLKEGDFVLLAPPSGSGFSEDPADAPTKSDGLVQKEKIRADDTPSKPSSVKNPVAS